MIAKPLRHSLAVLWVLLISSQTSTFFAINLCLVHVEAADAMAVFVKISWEKLALAACLATSRAAQVLASSSKSFCLTEGSTTLFALRSCLVHVKAADAKAVLVKILWEKLALAALAV